MISIDIHFYHLPIHLATASDKHQHLGTGFIGPVAPPWPGLAWPVAPPTRSRLFGMSSHLCLGTCPPSRAPPCSSLCSIYPRHSASLKMGLIRMFFLQQESKEVFPSTRIRRSLTKPTGTTVPGTSTTFHQHQRSPLGITQLP